MSRFQRMVVIPESEYNQLHFNKQFSTEKDIEKPLVQQFRSTSKQYEEEKAIPDDFTRLLNQGRTLERLKDIKNELRQHMDLGTPKQYRGRANALYSAIQSHIKLSDKGELIDMDDHIIPNSHISDLIQYAVRDKRRKFQPIGWSEFVQQLHDMNAPKSPLNAETIEEIKQLKFPSIKTHSPRTKPSFKQARGRLRIKPEISSNSDSDSDSLKRYGLNTGQKQRRLRVETKRYPKSSFLRY